MLQVPTAHRTERFRGTIQRSLGDRKMVPGGNAPGSAEPQLGESFFPGCRLLAMRKDFMKKRGRDPAIFAKK